MSSWKNAHKAYQKPHRERHQPESRQHLGHLEKKKDYKLRADDYNAKKAELKYLHTKALDRNPDEFYYHMINSQIEEGVHKDRAKQIEYTPDQVQLMQTQDYKYIVTRQNMESKKVEKLRANLHKLDEIAVQPVNQHTFFVDDEKEVKKFNLIDQLQTTKQLVNRRYNRLRVDDLKKGVVVQGAISSNKSDDVNKVQENLKEIAKSRQKEYKLLEAREARRLKLLRLQRKMELKRVLQDKKRRVKSRTQPDDREAAPVYEFYPKRK
jgi:U3 small nucleolar RNA-associated protein 11